MEKVDEKWFKKNGWFCWVDEVKVTEDSPRHKTIEHHTVYIKAVGNNGMKYGKYKRARWDHYYSRSYLVGKSGKEYLQGTSNYYIFGAFGDKFEVGNRISHRKFDVEKIEAACTLCGIK